LWGRKRERGGMKTVNGWSDVTFQTIEEGGKWQGKWRSESSVSVIDRGGDMKVDR
jgi:hypothetical protein